MDELQDIFTENELLNILKDFTRLKDKIYLDHAGAALYSESQIRDVKKDLNNHLYLNPHTSKYTNDCVDQIRYYVLNHFNADPEEYSIIFTSGATAALKLVAESFNFSHKHIQCNTKNGMRLKSGAFVYLEDNHTSVLGMRDIILANDADVINISRENLLKTMCFYRHIQNEEVFHDTFETCERALFVYPAQCNFSGYKYPLKWIDFVNGGILNEYTKNRINKTYSEWFTLLDAAAYVSTNKLNLSFHKPDFVCISFYKIFGYPTGLGALIVKNNSAETLSNKTYYGGGTVEIAMSKINHHVKRKILHERFEDGTIPFLSILAVKHGFDAIHRIIPKIPCMHIMDKISKHTFYLSRILYHELKSLRHSNGNHIAILYADSAYNDINIQGGIVNFNLLRGNGEYIGYAEVVHMAELFNISVRSGCFCNPGACQRHLRLTNNDLIKHHRAGHKCGDNYDLVDGTPTGSIRVSFGYMSTMKDVKSLIDMIISCFVEGSVIDKRIEYIQTKSDNIKKYIVPQKLENKPLKIKHTNIVCDFETFDPDPKGVLKEICIYPIKSCAPYKVYSSWEIGVKGLKYDREWMIITGNGTALTQKHDTRMCLIHPIIDLDRNMMRLTFPGAKEISVSLYENEYRLENKYNLCHSKVCNDRVEGYDCGNDVANWLTDVLGLLDLRLIKQTDTNRNSKMKANKTKDSSIALSNQAQYLLVNEASVKWLADKVKTGEFNSRINNLTARFRANLIIEGSKEFEEFSWKRIKIGSNIFDVDGPCTRCQMVCIDQENGTKTTEPLRTISKELQGKLHFGIYLSKCCFDEDKINELKCGSCIHVESDM